MHKKLKSYFKKSVMRNSFLLIFILVHSLCLGQIPKYLTKYKKEYDINPREANKKWFKEAQFGLFIHYGMYSLLGKGEWVQFRDTIPLEEYEQLKNSFTAEKFNANAIVKLAKKAGMKYITITSKHHDGFCLFNTKETDYNSLQSAAKRDLIGELAKACNKSGIGLFLYYSYGADWHHPYFYSPTSNNDLSRPFYKVQPKSYKYENPDDFKKYIAFVHSQLTELLTQYPTIAGIWFDPIRGVYNRPELFPIAETYQLIRKLSPHALISFKQGANGDEDFMAPERSGTAKVLSDNPLAKKVYALNQNKQKEICNTMQKNIPTIPGGNWGYNKGLDNEHLNITEVKQILQEAKVNGYNLLLNIGPLPDGSVHPKDFKTLSHLKYK